MLPSPDAVLPCPCPAVFPAGEDLEAFAGAGLYDSVPFPALEHRAVEYAGEPLLWDAGLRGQLLGEMAQLGASVEQAFGGVPQACAARGGAVVACGAAAERALRLRSGRRGQGNATPSRSSVPASPPPGARPQDIEGVRTADGAWYVVQSRPQVLH